MSPNSEPGSPYRYSEEFGIFELAIKLWEDRVLIAAVTVLAAMFSMVFAFFQPNIYEARALLQPKAGQDGGASALTRQYGGLASLAGISLPSGSGQSKTQLALQVLKSKRFAYDFAERHDLLPALFALESVDAAGTLRFDSEVYDDVSGRWLRIVGPPRGSKPSAEELHEHWSEFVSAYEDKETGFVTLIVRHRSPALAKRVVDWLITDINETLRAQDLADAERAISYLEGQLKITTVAEVRMLLASLLRSHTESRMMATVDPSYVFAVIDPATQPEYKVAPKRTLISTLGALLGGCTGVFGSLLRRSLRSRADAGQSNLM